MASFKTYVKINTSVISIRIECNSAFTTAFTNRYSAFWKFLCACCVCVCVFANRINSNAIWPPARNKSISFSVIWYILLCSLYSFFAHFIWVPTYIIYYSISLMFVYFSFFSFCDLITLLGVECVSSENENIQSVQMSLKKNIVENKNAEK